MKTDILLICTLFLTFQSPLIAQAFDLDTIYSCPGDPSEEVDYYVLDFWATWCGPCVKSMPHINKVNKANKYKNIKFISITNESKAVIDKFITYKEPIETCIGISKDYSILEQYGFRPTIPKILILDKEGKLIWDGNPIELDTNLLNSIVKNQKVTYPGEYSIQYSIKGPIYTDSNSVWLRNSGKYKAIEMFNRDIEGLYYQILLLRDGDNPTIELKGEIPLKYHVACEFRMDSSTTDSSFYNMCIEILNTSFNSTIEKSIDTLDYFDFHIKDSMTLLKNRSSRDSTTRTIGQDYITYNCYPLKYLIADIIHLYNLRSDYDIRNVPSLYNEKLDVRIANVELEQLREELSKIGIYFEINTKSTDIYTLSFEE